MKYKGLILATALTVSELFGTQVLAEEPSDDVKAFEQMFGEGPQEEDVYRADKLLVSATGSLKPVHLAPSVATVITAEEIEEMGATTLDEVLETVPGLHVEPSGTAFFSSIWSIRGLHTGLNPDVLMLINGVPFTLNYHGSRIYGYQMPVSMISRVEVVRGPGSALYGADAYAGVINIITRDNHEIDGTRIGMRGGSFGSYDAWVQHGAEYGGWELAFGVEWQKTKGDDGRTVKEDWLHAIGLGGFSNAPGPLDTSYELLDSHLNVRKGRWNLHLYGTLQECSMGPGAQQAVTYGNDGDTASLLTDLRYENEKFYPDWSLLARMYYSYMHDDQQYQFVPNNLFYMVGNPILESQDGGVELSGIYSGFTSHQVRLGFGWKNYNFEPDQYRSFGFDGSGGLIFYGTMVHITDPDEIFISSANRHLWFGLIQDEWQISNNWTLTAGVRHDKYSDFGSTTNPRAALVWEARYDLTAKIMYGQAFRAPSFGEQYTKNNTVSIGSADLDPQEIETIELAFDYQPTNDLRFILSLFNYEAEDLIEMTGASPAIMSNYGKQEGHGLEVEMDWQITESLRLRSNFAYHYSEYKQTGEEVPDAAGIQFYLNPHWSFTQDWSLGGQFFVIADRERGENDPRNDIDDFEIVNLTLRRKNIAKHWEAAVAIRNLFDEDARISSPYDPSAPDGAYIPEDYPMAGRAIWGEVRLKF